MTLIENSACVWHKLWSVRLALLAAVASAVEVGWNVYVNGQTPIIACATCFISLCAAGARLVAQPKLTDGT